MELLTAIRPGLAGTAACPSDRAVEGWRWRAVPAFSWARSLKRDAHAIYLAARDPARHVRALACVSLATALAHDDARLLPVVGYLDEVVILPLGIWRW